MSQSMNPKKNRLSLMALEHRWVFDGAAPVDALQKLGSDTPLHLFDLAAATGSSPLLAQAQKDAQNTIAQWMSQPDAAQKLAGIYAGGQPSQDWLDKAQGVVDAFRRGELSVRVELRSSQELMGLWAAFAGQNGQGDPVIYINADWLQTTGNDAQAVGRVLAEEWGHYLDVQLNGQMDAEGDEGELFAASVYQLDLSQAQRDRIAFENDHIKLYIDGREVQVEMASLLFNGQSYFAGIAPLAAGASTADGTTGGQTAQLESNVLYIGNKLLGDRTVFVSDPPDAAYYSGNNVRGWLYAIDTNNNIVGKYYGEISRLIKEGSAPVAAQMYVYNDPQQPGITNQLATTIILDFYKDRAPTLATGQIAKTSSDPVASALNSLLPVNQPPTANPDTGFALEAGGLNNATPGSNASGNVISGSDTDPNSTYVVDLASNKLITVQDVLTITKVSNASAGTTTTTVAASGTNINGLYGTLTMAADGTYTYVVNNNLAAVQALRGTSNTLNDVYTYTVSDGKGGFSTTTLTITVRGANDNPQAKDDYNFAKESIESTVANQYSATDAFGQKATGNVLTNDTDIDGYSETKRVAGVTASATVTTVSTSLTLNFTSVPSNVSVGRFVWLDGDGILNNQTNGSVLRDASGNAITVTAVTSTTATLSGVPVYQSGPNQGQPIDLTPNMILGFSNNTAGSSYSEARIKDAGIAPSTTFRVDASLSGQLAVGMTVSGDGVPANTTITGITYKADGTINLVTISNAIAVSGATLNFSAGSFPMTLTGQYGTLVLQENGDYVYTPFANNPALNSGDMFVDAFRYNMWDAAGAVSTATLYINVMGSGPSDPDANADTVTAIEAGGTANGTAGNNPTGNLLSNDTLGNVPSGATLSVVAVKTTETAPANASALTGSITFDGVTYAAKVTGQYGDLYVKADGTYRYVVNNTDPVVQALRLSSNQLTDTFQYKITNGSGFNWSSLTVTINGANDAPVAVNDSITAIVGEYVPVGNVLANDTDVDAGDTKTVTKIALGSTLPGSNNVTSSTSYSSGYTEIQGTYGTLRIGADGSFTYLVDANNAAIKALGTGQLLSNPDVFTYEMRDAAGLLSTASMTMNVEGRNDAPVNTMPATFTAQEGSSYAFTGAGNTVSASDVDNNLAATTVSVLNGTLAVSTAGSTAVMEGGVQVGITLAGGAVLYFDRAATEGGDLTLTGNGTSNFTLYGTQAQINAALATLVYTPNVGYVGSDTLRVESIDAEGLKDVDTVSVTVAAPALTVTGTTVNEASPYTLFSVSGKEGQSIKLSLESTGTTAGHATLGTDTGLTLQYFNGSTWVTYNPAANGGYVVMPSDTNGIPGENATLLVRVANVQDTTNEGAETLKLVATNAAGTAANGTSTIKDDGTGSYFAADNNTATSNVPAGVTLDDDRPLTVNSITVNEGSPYAVFTVSGAAGQLASLNLAGQNSDGSDLSVLQYWDGDSWETYTSGTVALDSNGKLLVRVALSPEQETALDGPETFNLVATNTGGTSGIGQATIKDDGTGTLYTAANPTVVSGVLTPVTDISTPLDDDRALSVNSFEINEGSPYAVFTVTGAPNQLATLALNNGTTTGMTGLEVYTGGAWVPYTSGTVTLDSAGKLLVRTSMTPEQEAGIDNGETFTLTASNTGGTGSLGTATVKDDGTGALFSASNSSGVAEQPGTNGLPAQLDDDRVLQVSNVTVNEGSPYAVFTVTGANGQIVKLSLDGASGDTPTEGPGGAAALGANPALQYYEAGVWKTYDANNPPKISDGTTLLVRVAINAEQETALDGPETFRLVATNTGGTDSAANQGVATIRDDGQGGYFAADNNTATSSVPAGVRLDDDRTVTVNSFNINEGSPYAVFTVTATTGALQAGQLVTLALADGTSNGTTGMTGLEVYDANANSGSGAWVAYTGGTVALDSAGKLLVRTAMTPEQDAAVDNGETFTLTVTNTGGAAVVGTATVKDDGTGDYFAADSNTGTPVLPADKVLDDDRPLTITDVTVSEAAGPAAFEITGAVNQWVKLELQTTGTGTGHASLTSDISSTFTYTKWNGTGWVAFTPTIVNGYIQMPADATKIQVLVPVTRDALVEGNETFYLAASNTGGSVVRGTGTIQDYAPAAAAITAEAVEAGGVTNGTAGFNPSSLDVDSTAATLAKNLVTENTTAQTGTLTLSAMANPATGNGVTTGATINSVVYASKVVGAYGTVYFNADGSWVYEVDNSNTAVQALRLSTNTLTETFNYTLTGTTFPTATSTLVITIKGANDAPVANPDYNTAKESLRTDNTAYDGTDPLGYKATGNVLPNDTDVDAGDTKTVVGIDGSATVSSVSNATGTATLIFTPGTTFNPVSKGDEAWYLDGSTWRALFTNADGTLQVTADGGYNATTRTIPLSSTPAYYWNGSGYTSITNFNNVVIGFKNSSSTTTETSGSMKSGTVSSATSTATSTVSLSGFTGTVATGMRVSWTGMTDGTVVTVSSVTYDGSGNPVSVLLDANIPTGTASLNFTAAAGSTITGRYGTLQLNSDGSYTYTPIADNPSISEGEFRLGIFHYTMRDAEGLTSHSTLTITILGSGSNDPNAVADTAIAVEAGGTTNGTAGTNPTGNVLTGDTTPAGGSLVVIGGRTASASAFNDLYVTTTGAVTSGSSTITVTDAAGLVAGMSVQGNGIPANTTISTISGNTLTLSNNATISGASTSLLFTQPTASTTLTGLYGSLLLRSNGTYEYTVNNDNPQVQALLLSTNTLTDQFQYKVANGYFSTGANGSSAGLLLTDVATLTVTIQGANDAPTLDLNTPDGTTSHYAATYTEGSVPVSLLTANGVSIADVDSNTFEKLTLSYDKTKFTNTDHEKLVFTAASTAGGSVTEIDVSNVANAASGTVTLGTVTYTFSVVDTAGAVVITFGINGAEMTTAQAEALLDALQYKNTSENPSNPATGARVFSIAVFDGGTNPAVNGTGSLSSNVATSTITVVPVNDAPELDLHTTAGYDYSASYTVGGGSVAIAGTVNISDVDDIHIEKAIIKLTNKQSGDSLTVGELPDGLTSSISDAGGVITVTLRSTTGNMITREQYAAAISAITFNSTGTSYVNRTIEVTVNDGQDGEAAANRLDSNTAVSTIVVNPDNRSLSVAGSTVNEASPYVLFTVGGAVGQRVTLELGTTGTGVGHAVLGLDTANPTNATATTADDVPLQYFDPSASGGIGAWVDYVPGTSITLGSTGKVLVRTAVVNDSMYEGAETLALIARNDAGTPASGSSTIKDDGTGTLYQDQNPTWNATTGQWETPVNTTSLLNDDRPLTVNSITVNEASPYAVFTVTGPAAGQPSQKVLLSLTNASGDTPAEIEGGKANILVAGDYDNDTNTPNTLPPLQYFDPSANNNAGAWVTYNSSNPPSIAGGGSLLVRVAISAEQETALDGPETFNLVATNTGGTSGVGAATIVDNGTGSLFSASNTTGTPETAGTNGLPALLDDDRLLSVSNVTVNEASPYAVFTVTGATGQTVKLALADASGNYVSSVEQPEGAADLRTGATPALPTLQYFNTSSNQWVNYSESSPPTILTGTTLLVRVSISAEQEAAFDGPETFRLVATNTGGTSTPNTQGVGTIRDDGQGSIYLANNNTATPNQPGDQGPAGGVNYPAQLDDDRVLTVSNVEVNEGSPYAVFTVTGANGQIVKLSLDGASGDTPTEGPGGAADLGTNPALEYFEGGVWKTYDANNPPKISDGTTLLVRVAINAEQETDLDGPETFRLVATNTGGTDSASNQGVATIRDDGQGDYWIGDATAAATSAELTAAKIYLDDDRVTPVTISSPTVNEASPYAVFTVTGALNQLVSLNLAPGTAGANVDFVSKLEYSPDGTTWLPYTGGNVSLSGAGGTLLVRVPIINDDTLEPDETFTLTATNTGGTPATGTATITDDGNGAYWFGNSATPATPEQLAAAGKVLDDDRPLTIAPVTVNEASPFAVFTVSGASNQLASLALNNVTTSGLSGLEYYDPVTAKWEPYTPNSYVPLDSAGKLLVRVAISPEQEALQDGPETFNLVATNTGGTSGTGLGTIRDDGQGLLFSATNMTGNPENPGAAPGLPARLDDDRPLTVGNITVNEGSPVAVFTVTGAPGQVALLALGNAAAANPAGDAIGGNAALGTILPTLQYLNASNQWVDYIENSPPVVGNNGKLLVRVSITPESDGVFDGPETFQLRATNTGGSTGVGTATILDDGTGSYWIADTTAPATPAQLETAGIKLDDDRPITVVGGTYNEGSPRAVFTVTANAGQLLTLGVEDVQTTGLAAAPLSYSVDGGATWLPYTGAFVAGPVPVLVAVNITSERDEVYEVSEEFRLVVNPGLPTRAAASGFIVDDGTGDMYDANGNAMPATAERDDDRPRLQVEGPASPVSEGSPAVFSVSLSKTLLGDTPIELALTPGTASVGDFAMGDVFYLNNAGEEVLMQRAQDGRYIVPAGLTNFYVRVLTTQDSNYEGLENLRLQATLPASVGGASAGADAGIIDDGSGVVYTGKVDPEAGLLVDTAARPDDDRPVAAMVDPAPVPAPALVPPPLPPAAPSLHVQFAVADARSATSGAASVASGGVLPVSPAGAGMVMQALDAQFEKFERPTDPNLFVLPAVNTARGQAFEAQVPSVTLQSGLLWNELLSDGIGAGVVMVSQAGPSTLADAELARLAEAPATQATEQASLDDAEQTAERLKAQLRAARLALAQEPANEAAEPVRGHNAFSRQLQQAAKRPVWMARSSRA